MNQEDKEIEKHRLYQEQQRRCSGCNVAFERRNLELDRIVPGSKGGTYERGNLQLLCNHCNRVKGNRSNSYLKLHVKLRRIRESVKVKVRL